MIFTMRDWKVGAGVQSRHKISPLLLRRFLKISKTNKRSVDTSCYLSRCVRPFLQDAHSACIGIRNLASVLYIEPGN